MSAAINKPGTRGINHVLHAARYSLQGYRAALSYEEAFRLELLLFIILAPLGLWLGDNGIERALLVGSLLLVLIVELLNSAIETVVDRVSVENHELSGRAKDIGSAAVMTALAAVWIVWGLILWPQI
jgi:diacylglycerol kinase (ATP)